MSESIRVALWDLSSAADGELASVSSVVEPLCGFQPNFERGRGWLRTATARQIRTTALVPGSNPSGSSVSSIRLGFFRGPEIIRIKRDHICVDSGCGTLRIGQHVMKYLHAGNYWGRRMPSGRGLVSCRKEGQHSERNPTPASSPRRWSETFPSFARKCCFR
jgi:hypothetical protein